METPRYRHLVLPYVTGNGIDIGSGGVPVTPTTIQIEMSRRNDYGGRDLTKADIEWEGDGLNLPFRDGTLDYVYSSHLLEDFADWRPALAEWSRVLKPGGNLIILIPDKARWERALANGQPPNLSHKHEGRVGELTGYAAEFGWDVIEDRLTDLDAADYSILFVAKKAREVRPTAGAWWEQSRRTLKVAHSGDLGDAIYAMAAVRELCRQQNCQADVTLYRAEGVREAFDNDRAMNIGSLLAAQKYVRRYRFVDHPLAPGEVQFDFAGWRREYVKSGGIANLGVTQCEWAGVDPACLSNPWMEINPTTLSSAGGHKKTVVVCRSHRYRGHTFPWGELAERYATRAIVLGTVSEYQELYHGYGWGNYVPTPNLSDVASLIEGAELVITNQTCVRAIAEALKKPVVMERCDWVPNVDFDRPDVWAGEERVKEFLSMPDFVTPEDAPPMAMKSPAIRGVTTAA